MARKISSASIGSFTVYNDPEDDAVKKPAMNAIAVQTEMSLDVSLNTELSLNQIDDEDDRELEFWKKASEFRGAELRKILEYNEAIRSDIEAKEEQIAEVKAEYERLFETAALQLEQAQ